MDDQERLQANLERARVIADPRKFREYVLVPSHISGKDRIFLGMLGFRPHSSADAWALARLYELQASERVASGGVQFSRTIPFGVLCTMVIDVRGASLRTVWLLADDLLRLVTPFSGFVHGTTEG